MKFTRWQILAVVTFAAGPVLAQQLPDTLRHSIPPPFSGLQAEAKLGFSVALDGGYIVAGAPNDDTGVENSGVVKVFDSTTGALLHVLPDPRPALEVRFGNSVAISGTLVVAGAPGGFAGSAYVYDLASATPSVPVVTLNHPPVTAHQDGFGISVAISGTRVVVGAPFGGAANSGIAYVYDLSSPTPGLPVITFSAPSAPAPAEGDGFGASVAISGTWIVAGAFASADVAGANAGRAYVYDLNGVTPTVPFAVLNNPAPAFDDRFGSSVAVSGTRVVVGAVSDDWDAPDAGSVHVFDLSSGTPAVPVFTLNNPDAGLFSGGDFFGNSVAISGSQVVAGAFSDDEGAVNAGSVYVYDLLHATPTVPVRVLRKSGPSAEDWFGHSVAIAGTRVVVGTPRDDTGAADAGSAYVYDLNGASPTVPVVVLNNPGPVASDYFGFTVAISGNLAVIGAYFADGGNGRAYVYDLGSATPTVPIVTLHNPGEAFVVWFGYSVAISGTRVAVGADNFGELGAGRAYVYDVAGATPAVPVATLRNPTPAMSESFGRSVAISGTRVAVGDGSDDTEADGAGSVFVYDLGGATPTVPVVMLHNPDSEPSYDGFGDSVAIFGARLVVGAANNDTGQEDAGSAYVYDLSSATPTVPVATLNNPGPAANDRFGESAAISGSLVVVGARWDDTGAVDAGSAYVYDLARATPAVPIATLNNPADGEYFGISAAVSGTRVVIGTYKTGKTHVYDFSGAIPAVPAVTLIRPAAAPQGHAYYNDPVAIDGEYVVVGTPNDSSVVAHKGFAYIFGPHPDADGDGLLDSWELTHWPTIASQSALDDFDHDGYPELLELALGLNPTIADPGGLPPVTNEGGYLTMTIMRQPGVTYEVQSAGTLLPAVPDSFSPATTTVLIDTANTLKVRDNVLIGTAQSRFLRVKVTAAP